jgi:hypothetical protein
MTEEDKTELAAEIADELQDSCGIATEADRDLTARCIVDRMESWFRHQGWLPPETYGRIGDWMTMTQGLPEHHINRSVLNSHLVELADILHGR